MSEVRSFSEVVNLIFTEISTTRKNEMRYSYRLELETDCI